MYLLSPEGQYPVSDFLEHFLNPIPVFVSLGQGKQYSNALEFHQINFIKCFTHLMRGQAYDMFRISVGRGDRAGVAQGVFFFCFFY